MCFQLQHANSNTDIFSGLFWESVSMSVGAWLEWGTLTQQERSETGSPELLLARYLPIPVTVEISIIMSRQALMQVLWRHACRTWGFSIISISCWKPVGFCRHLGVTSVETVEWYSIFTQQWKTWESFQVFIWRKIKWRRLLPHPEHYRLY